MSKVHWAKILESECELSNQDNFFSKRGVPNYLYLIAEDSELTSNLLVA